MIVDLVNDLMDEMIDDFIDQFIIVYRFWMDGKTLVRFIDRMLDRSID